MERTFSMPIGIVDASGEKIMPGALKVPDNLILTHNFDPEKKLGTVKDVIFQGDKMLVAVASTEDEEKLWNQIESQLNP